MIDFFKGKKVFLTGHTGFKGTWLCRLLINARAEVTGYALEPPTNPSLFKISGIGNQINSIIGDIRDFIGLEEAFNKLKPEIVIHLAAQPLVKDSYTNPHYTYETNVMGTVNVLECVRKNNCVKSMLNVTTDKVYQNNEWVWGYREDDNLGGYDPYSNSKSCSELVTHSYKKAFFSDRDIGISTARAGNVLGGGDFSKDRIIPDCVRAVENNIDIVVRNPYSIRPYQHVLDPLYAYLVILRKQYKDIKYADYYNIGPEENDCIATGKLVSLFCRKWELATGVKKTWINKDDGGPHEASFLKLDCSKFKSVFGWQPSWSIENTVEKTVEWTKVYLDGGDTASIMDKQIDEFLEVQNKCLKI